MKTPQMSSKSGGKAPHCKVCGDESSGFHYGVDSCEGCKGFFRRCITQGMNHKCANEEKCDITPFTRNSCQYCRLKKCFEVGMSREASRLGRRPKRLKEVGGETSGVRTHTGNLPIAPYPSPQELYKLRMAELQKILQSNGTFKAELMQAFLSAAKASFQEHSKSNTGDVHGPTSGKGKQHPQHQKQLQIGEAAGLGNINQPGGSPIPSTSTVLDTSAPDSVGLGAGVSGLSGVDSPSSLHSPGGSMIDLSNFGAFENFLFDQGNMPATPGNQNSLDAMSELQSLNSPFNINNVSLDPVSNATSPLSDSGLASPLAALGSVSSVTNGAGMAGQEGMVALNLNLLNTDLNVTAPSTPSPCVLQYQQSYHGYSSSYGGVQVKTEMSEGGAEVKTEPGISYSSCSVKAEMPGTSFFSSSVKTEVDPLSPESSSMSFVSPIAAFDPRQDLNKVDVAAIMEEVRQTPSQTRRVMIDQVTDAIVEAHLTTTINTSKAIGEANKRINETQTDTDDITNDLAKLKLEANNMWQRIFTAMVPEITQVVRFCKKLPGFQEIEQDDQIRLIKQGAFEVMVARCSLLVDHEKQTMLDPTLSMRTSRIVLREMPLGQFLDEIFSVAKEFNPLNLTDGEVGLFTAILIISPIRKNLANVRTVKKLQSLFQQALFYLMKHNHADPDLKFSQLMGLMPMFHRINEEHFKALNNIRINSEQGGQTVDFPDLHKEVFDCST